MLLREIFWIIMCLGKEYELDLELIWFYEKKLKKRSRKEEEKFKDFS